MTGLLIAGTSSDAGKSLFVTGLCRVARNRGIDVAPFKAQNMGNNSMVCPDGSEIGRAQYLQAIAADLEPESAMNPVLLKPGSDRTSEIILRGQPAGSLASGEYATGRQKLAASAWQSYEELAKRHDLVVCEGAGSPAEINLRAGDYTNMGLARRFNLPVILIGDIDRGGVLAALFGTWALLDEQDRSLLAGYVINKFRGDESILAPGLAEITRRTGLVNLGVLPWLADIQLDGEDSLALSNPTCMRSHPGLSEPLAIAVVRLPRVVNATDVDALAQEPGIQVLVTSSPEQAAAADLVIVPGTRSPAEATRWLEDTGMAGILRERVAAQRPILGIANGFRLLSNQLPGHDGNQLVAGTEKGRGASRRHGSWRGHQVHGYETHGSQATLAQAADPGAEAFPGGLQLGAVWGTTWHGIFENDGFRRSWLTAVANQARKRWESDPASPAFAERREAMITTVAAAIEEAVDVEKLFGWAR